jgi:hypothetical protein
MCLAKKMEEGEGRKHNPGKQFDHNINCSSLACSLDEAVEGSLHAFT